MIKRFIRLIGGNAVVSMVVVAIIAGLVLQFTGRHTALHWTLSAFALAATLPLLVDIWQDMRHGHYGVDLLAVIGIVTAVILGQGWTAIALVAVRLLTGLAEKLARMRAKGDIGGLFPALPETAHLVRARKVVDVRIGQLKAGDKVVVKTGESVPADAVVIEGAADFDEAVLTGENLPQSRAVGQAVPGGAVNLGGAVTLQVLHTVQDSQYRHLTKLARTAGSGQSAFGQTSAAYTMPFAIAVLAIGGAVWAISGHAIRFLDVVVAASPAPLAATVPIAFLGGLNRALRNGIFPRGAGTLEKLADAATLALNKTGTLTTDTAAIDTVTTFFGHKKDEVLSFAVSLEQNSDHVLARAIAGAAAAKKLKLTKAKHVQASPGQGLKAHIKNVDVLIGRFGFLEAHGIVMPPAFKAASIKQAAAFVAIGGELAGVITFREDLRPESQLALETMRRLGLKRSLLVTGDGLAAAHATAQHLNISEVWAEALPADKLQALEDIRERPLVFVANSPQDATALAAVDVGIAVDTRSITPASEAAAIIIPSPGISRVALAVSIAKRTVKFAQLSLLVGVGISLALAGLFATGILPPLAGALLRELATLAAITIALRTRTGKDELV